MPFHSLDFALSTSFGAKDNWSLTLRARNILNDNQEQVYRSFGTDDAIFSLYQPGVGFGVTVGYSF